MAPLQVIFVQHSDQPVNRRAKELENAAIRSHAARASHSRKKKSNSNHIEPQGHAKDPPHFPIRQEAAYHNSHWRHVVRVASVQPIRTVLGQGKVDPFSTDRSGSLPAVIRAGMEYAYEVLWPRNFPGFRGEARQALVTRWRRGAVYSTLEFHAQVSNSASLCFSLAANSAIKETLLTYRLIHQSRAMKEVREELSALTGPAPDALITNIMGLATQGGELMELPPAEAYAESPMVEIQCVKLYSRFAMGLTHLDACIMLTQQRGGIDCLEAGLSQALQMAELVISTRLNRRPKFPLLSSLKQVAEFIKFDFDLEAHTLCSNLGRGFLVVRDTSSELFKIVLRAAELTAALDQLHRLGVGHLDGLEMAMLTIVFQHNLYSLSRPLSTTVAETQSLREYRYDLCRVSLAIYSDFVLFPSTPGYNVQPRLAGEVSQLLLAIDKEDTATADGDGWSDILLWATVMGGIAANGASSRRRWYQERLYRQTIMKGISFTQLTNCMSTLLWWDHVFEDRLADLWMEALHFGQPQAVASWKLP